jgi:hypothetical protein
VHCTSTRPNALEAHRREGKVVVPMDRYPIEPSTRVAEYRSYAARATADEV